MKKTTDGSRTTSSNTEKRKHTSEIDAPGLATRLRCKAEACRVACLEADADTRDPHRRWLCENKAKALGVDLWMLRPTVMFAGLSEELIRLADCINATASAVECLVAVTHSPRGTAEMREKALENLAEAQSMMRAAHLELQRKLPGLKPQPDSDQREAFTLFQRTTKRNHIFVRRYSRKNDVADTAQVGELLERIERLNGGVNARLVGP